MVHSEIFLVYRKEKISGCVVYGLAAWWINPEIISFIEKKIFHGCDPIREPAGRNYSEIVSFIENKTFLVMVDPDSDPP